MELPGIEIRCIIAPDHCRYRQEVLKRILTMPVAFLHFLINSLQRGGCGGGFCSFRWVGCCWGALKYKIKYTGWFWTTCILLYLLLLQGVEIGRAVQGGNNIAWRQSGRCRKGPPCPSNVIGGAKHHWWRCQDIYSSFHIRNVGVGVIGGYCGCWFRIVVVSWTCGVWEAGVCYCRSSDTQKPCKPMFTGHKKWHGGSSGLAQLSIWPPGCVVDGGWLGPVVREHKNKKKTCKCQLAGLVFVIQVYYVSLGHL